jgi:poly-gamma-glutamate synthesis protein (capsule biosynthesis protein)
MAQTQRIVQPISAGGQARRGEVRAIASWLNRSLMPYGIRTLVRPAKPHHIGIVLELPRLRGRDRSLKAFQEHLLRCVCHSLWKLNSPSLDGATISARFRGQKTILWRKSVRIVTPANRQRLQQTQQLRSRIRQATRQRNRLRRTRTLLVGGPAVAALIAGGVLGYTKAPVNQTSAAASPQNQKSNRRSDNRANDSVRGALETVPAIKHTQVANPQDPTVTLMFSGDVTLAENFADVMGNDFNRAFAAMPEYRQADVAMVNLENPLTKATLPLPNKQFNFKAEPESVEVLKAGGVDVVTLANNHTMDFQAEGLVETMQTLDNAGIHHLGAGRNITEARRPKIIDVKGQRIAYFGYYGDLHAAGEKSAGTNPIEEERISQDIRAVRDQVDWVVVNYHWGQELADRPADWQVELARFTIDQGADLIVGHHPHVLQGAEVYKGRPIVYSLGNFIFGGNSRTDYDTAVLQVALKDQQMKVEFLPVEVRGYQPKVVKGDRGTEILRHLEQLSAGFQQPMKSLMVLDAQKPTTTGRTEQPATSPAPAISPALTPALPPIDGATSPSTGASPASVSPTLPQIESRPTSPDAFLKPPVGEEEAVPPAASDPTPDPLDPALTPVPAPSSDPYKLNSPTLPDFSNPSNSFTDSPSQTPLEPSEGAEPADSTTPVPEVTSPQLPPRTMLETPLTTPKEQQSEITRIRSSTRSVAQRPAQAETKGSRQVHLGRSQPSMRSRTEKPSVTANPPVDEVPYEEVVYVPPNWW